MLPKNAMALLLTGTPSAAQNKDYCDIQLAAMAGFDVATTASTRNQDCYLNLGIMWVFDDGNENVKPAGGSVLAEAYLWLSI
ncbi:uncharacterized protein PG998_014980 [Apiospora kogelbergensis]|uniref:uncharacterized protein n=1 Tax=Apiospora kogelbergensis TaxID=1337665 RepID=UPI00312ED652